MSRTNHSDW